MKDVQDLLQKRAKVIQDSRKLLDRAESEGRDLNDTEKSEYSAMESEIDALKNRADRLEKSDNLKNSLSEISGDSFRASVDGEVSNKFAQKEYSNIFNGFARNGQITPEVKNALQVGTNSEGGYIVPEEFETMLIAKMQDINPLRMWCNTITTASDRNIPVETTLGTADWTAEGASKPDSDAEFGQVILGSHKLTSIIKVSEELLQDAFFDVTGYLTTNFASRFGLAEEAAFVAGDGSGKPSGIVSGATDSGVTFAGVNAITADELIDLQHALTRPYRAGAVWLVNDATHKMIRKLKDGEGQYLWQAGLTEGASETLLGRPLYASTAMPLAATGERSVVFGDMSGYTIADRSNRTMQRLNELYAANGQIGFRMFSRTEGKVTDSNKIVYASQA